MSEKSISKMLFSNQEKVELNLINDAKRLIKSLDDIFEYKQEKDTPIAAGIEKLKSLKKEVINAKSDVSTYVSIEKRIPKFESQLKEAFSTLNFLDKAAKELGVKTESMKEYKELDDTIFVAKRDIEYLKKVVDLAKRTLKDF
jgi:phosphomevalonate kinase